MSFQFQGLKFSLFWFYFINYIKHFIISKSKLLKKIDSTCEYDFSYFGQYILGKDTYILGHRANRQLILLEIGKFPSLSFCIPISNVGECLFSHSLINRVSWNWNLLGFCQSERRRWNYSTIYISFIMREPEHLFMC